MFYIFFVVQLQVAIYFSAYPISLERQVENRIKHEFTGIFPTSQEVLLDYFFPRKDIDSHGTL